ncbi:VOC family protein [Hypericibacter sp.]|uniref:VOC family protein n=1 Tax=Hypericibacter sp. TaxID=2705401 RepID=UPI003D6D7F10
MLVQPYLMFDGRCEEAIEFYRRAVGAETTMLMRFKDSPEPAPPGMVPPGSENKVMHAAMKIGDSTVMATDGGCQQKAAFEGFSLTLTVPNEAEADRRFNALAEGGQVRMPLAKTFFSPRFGMLQDKFGVGWMVIVAH